jgi:ABC-type transport system involved in cytochrome c biogenesis permease subunit
MLEQVALWAALAAYALGATLAVGRAPATALTLWQRGSATALALALLLHTLSLGLRWERLGHGPFTTLHEILSSNLWSLCLVLMLAWWAVREVRAVVAGAVPVLLLLGLWLTVANPGAGHLPPTYDTPLLYLHTVVGKLYLGLLLVAVALGSVPLWRRSVVGVRWFLRVPDDRRLDELAHRFAAYAFVFDTLMLIVGAVWAQDAWGRYWAWDPLETWAFLTWLALALALHARATLRPAPAVFGAWLLATFVLAFLTFFGVPFISMAPHKGAV